jgi:putative sugar O-methyltransferase
MRRFIVGAVLSVALLLAGGYLLKQEWVHLLLNKKQPICFSDNLFYPELCVSILNEPAAFQNFKRSPFYNVFCEYANFEQGKESIEWILSHAPELLERSELFRKNDAIGNPRVFDYPKAGVFSPTTLHYIQVAGDLKKRFGSLDGWKILEIGGGYGGQCKILSDLFHFKSYTLLDLPESLLLAKKILDEQGVQGVSFLSVREDIRFEDYDLIISDLSFSEMDRTFQKKMIVHFKKAKRGYLICQPAQWRQIPFTKREYTRVTPLSQTLLLKEVRSVGLKTIKVEPEIPPTGKDHFLVIWD